ncbi:MAG: DNA repair protein RadC [Deltaproteobacteria bacterium]|nr:DNA repair protein RadC [Deltaproteobacteria bacterium]MBL7174432.1 DNA repair protein RadC [Desulfobacteraceae bacterium]
MGEKESKGKKVIHIKDWPEGDRPREMLLEKGPEALSDAALLAILLRIGRQGQDAVGLAREMLTEFGGFRGLMSATYEDLLNIKGIGKAKIAQILAAMEIVKRQLRQPLEKINIIENPRDLFEYLKASMSNLSREEFRLLHLNRSKHLIAEEVLFKGTVDFSAVYPREIVEAALRKKASALILAHNHPTGLPEASEEDIKLTESLVKACWTVDIPVIDHIIIGRGGFLSMKRDYPGVFEGDDEVA